MPGGVTFGGPGEGDNRLKPLLAAVFVLFLIGLAAWAAWAWWQERRRRWKLLALGAPDGLRLLPRDPFDLPDAHFQLQLFTRGHSRVARNVLHGRLDGLPVRLFDYQYETGSGQSRRTHRWQVALVQTDFRMPGLLVQPADRYDPLESIFGFDEVHFATEPFCRLFHVAGEDRQFAYQWLHPRLNDLLSAEPRLTLETSGQVLAVFQPGPAEPDEAVRMLRLACRIAAMTPEHLRAELAQEVEPPGSGPLDAPERAEREEQADPPG